MADHRSPFAPLLAEQGSVLLDGGLATWIESCGQQLDPKLWSAGLLRDRPEVISQAHQDFLEAGADCIASASYQATFPGFAAAGLDSATGEGLLRKSVELACRERDRFCEAPAAGRHRPLVAASIGPYGAWLADGSEYRGDYGLDQAALANFHRRRLAVLASSGADLLAFETIPSMLETRALIGLLGELPEVRAWISFSCAVEDRLADGSELRRAATLAGACPQIVAVGVNCLPPPRVSGCLEELRQATDKPLVAYPNSGEGWDAARRCWTEAVPAASLAELAGEWWAAGARVFGGCCRTTPAAIADLRRALRTYGVD